MNVPLPTVDDIKREVGNGTNAIGKGVKHLTAEEQHELAKAKQRMVDAGVPPTVVDLATSQITGASTVINDGVHGRPVNPTDVVNAMNPSPVPGFAFEVTQSIISLPGKINDALEAAKKAADQATVTGRTADDFLKQMMAFVDTFGRTLLGSGGVMLPLTLLFWGLVLYVMIALLVKVKQLFSRKDQPRRLRSRGRRVVIVRRAA